MWRIVFGVALALTLWSQAWAQAIGPTPSAPELLPPKESIPPGFVWSDDSRMCCQGAWIERWYVKDTYRWGFTVTILPTPDDARERCAAIREKVGVGFELLDDPSIGEGGFRALKATPLMRFERAYFRQGRACVGIMQEAPFGADLAAQAATMEMFVRMIEAKARELAA
jgi:hypothetical protein